MNYGLLFLSGILIASFSFIGLALNLFPKTKDFFEKRMSIMGSASAGIFLVTIFFLAGEADESLTPFQFIMSILLGLSVYFLVHKLLCSGHNEETRKKGAAHKVLVGDIFHNIADGIILVASFTLGKVFGISALLSMLLHETPQEFSKFIILRNAGYSPLTASWKSFQVALAIFAGIGLGLALNNTEAIRGIFLGAGASFFLGVVFHDLFPIHSIFYWKRKKVLSKHLFALFIGIALMSMIAFLTHHH